MIAAGTEVCSLHFKVGRSLQNQLNDELMWCLVVFQHDCMPSTFSKVKKSYSWGTSSVLKEVVYLCRHFTQTESHEANTGINTVESASKWTSTTPVAETSESIKPNDTDLELNAIGYTLFFLRYSSLKCSKQTFTVRSAIVNSLTFTSSVFPSEANGETEKNSFSPVEHFSPF